MVFKTVQLSFNGSLEEKRPPNFSRYNQIILSNFFQIRRARFSFHPEKTPKQI